MGFNSVFKGLMHKILFYNKFIISLYIFRAHIEHCVLIIRRSKLYYTASGIITITYLNKFRVSSY